MFADKWSASEDEITARDNMKEELLSFIRQKYPDANLSVFGSSNNGFGSRQSDVDLCLTFGEQPDGEVSDGHPPALLIVDFKCFPAMLNSRP